MNAAFVSRAGDKLAFALNHFDISVEDLVCGDFGSSTGGFVDVLLQNGASKVYSIDTSYGELAWELRKNAKVIVLERTNALFVALPELLDFASVDVSFTKQEKILPNVLLNLKSYGTIVSLLKPHYEAPREMLKKGMLEDRYVDEVVTSVIAKIKDIKGVVFKDVVESPIKGLRGKNREFLLFLLKA